MADQKVLKSRLIQKHEYEVDWNNAVNFIPLEAEIIVYNAEADQNGNLFEGVTLPEDRTTPYTYARIKIGDGVTKVKDLPFVDDGKPGEITITGANYGQSDYAEVCGERFNDYEGNKALAAGSHAEGVRSIEYDGTKQTIIHNVAGCGCFEIDSKNILNSYYYYPNFNITNKTITVKGDASAYAAGDVISVITDTNFDECATIASVAYNGSDKTVITLQEWPEGLVQGSSSLLNTSEWVKSYTPMTLRVVAKPLIGTTFLGLGAHTEGLGSRALADGAHAEGRETQAVGRYGHTEGRETKAYYAAHAEGWKSQAIGNHAHAEGEATKASGYNAHAEGDSSTASGKTSHAEGYDTLAEGNMSHAEGNKTQATGYASHTEGDQNIASNSSAHAEGYKNQATGKMSHAEGDNNIAAGESSHAEGRWTEANHQGSHAGGYATKTGLAYQTVIGRYNKGKINTLFEVGNGSGTDEEKRANAFEVYADGHAELQKQGEADNAVVINSTLNAKAAEIIEQLHGTGISREVVESLPAIEEANDYTIYMVSNNSSSEDNIYNEYLLINNNWEMIGSTEVDLTNYYIKKEVDDKVNAKPGTKTAQGGEIFNDVANIASGSLSHAEGHTTQALAYAAHAEGDQTQAQKSSAHAEGYKTIAMSEASHAEGESTQAIGSDSHAEGRKTKAGKVQADGTVIGTTAHAEGNWTTAEAYASHAEGSETLASAQYAHAEGLKSKAQGDAAHAEGNETTASGNYSHAEGERTTASVTCSHAEGSATIASGLCAHAEGNETTASGFVSHAEGNVTTASGGCSHAEGSSTTASGNYSHAEGSSTTAEGDVAHAEGGNTTASGECSHAEGCETEASGNNSHAEGWLTKATGSYSHAEGNDTIASGSSAHAEGSDTIASGSNSHASGKCTIANYDCQFVLGKYNQSKENTLFEVGNGTSAYKYTRVAWSSMNDIENIGQSWYYNGNMLFENQEGDLFDPTKFPGANPTEAYIRDYSRSNAFEVYEDGHAELQTQGETDNSVVTKGHVDSLIEQTFIAINKPKAAMILTDNTTGINYRLYISDGKLQMEVAE